ncbi:dual specificity protein phosphatase 14-like [Uloborus diversus]|uniref:dual specificity protein phosphatase 14-like n=1 Tax=Uloborus diversus TaxID=327109 RepID=UPI00240968BD|nr:dual specificity protein phosphatase 14-like [Uloborus diversus]
MLSELNEVTDHLFIGSAKNVSENSLNQKGITCIINCSMVSPSYPVDKFKYIPIMVEDNDRQNIAKYLDEVADIIREELRAGGKTLVYCFAGISRSATFCIAYLMKHQAMSLRSAFQHLRSRRRIIRPNNGFFQQLIEYERRLFGATTVEMVPVPNADTADCTVPDVFYEVCKGIVWLRSCRKSLGK